MQDGQSTCADAQPDGSEAATSRQPSSCLAAPTTAVVYMPSSHDAVTFNDSETASMHYSDDWEAIED